MGFYLPPFKNNMVGGRRKGKREATDERYSQEAAHEGNKGKGERTGNWIKVDAKVRRRHLYTTLGFRRIIF